MQVEYHSWWSRHLEREMALKVYGHWGEPLVVFPCSRGRFFDYEGMGMIAAVASFIEAGRIKLFTVDSIDAESWYDFSVPPAVRNARHEAYERYVVEEVVAFIRDHCRGGPQLRPLTNGCSMGAYHALNFFLKHPESFGGTIALSGLYRLDRSEFNLGPDHMAAVYFNSPLSYLPGLEDPNYLRRYRDSRIMVCAGQGAWDEEALADTRELDALLRAKGVPARVEYWGHDVNHDWPWWFRQMNHFLGLLYG
jgi:esterase/lipase superfamily enzyme